MQLVITLMLAQISTLAIQNISAQWADAASCQCMAQTICKCCVDFSKLNSDFSNEVCFVGGDGKSVQLTVNDEVAFDTKVPKKHEHCLKFKIGAVLCIGLDSIEILPETDEIKVCTSFILKLLRTTLTQVPAHCIKIGSNFVEKANDLEDIWIDFKLYLSAYLNETNN